MAACCRLGWAEVARQCLGGVDFGGLTEGPWARQSAAAGE
jgi:hypothetical protein